MCQQRKRMGRCGGGRRKGGERQAAVAGDDPDERPPPPPPPPPRVCRRPGQSLGEERRVAAPGSGARKRRQTAGPRRPASWVPWWVSRQTRVAATAGCSAVPPSTPPSGISAHALNFPSLVQKSFHLKSKSALSHWTFAWMLPRMAHLVSILIEWFQGGTNGWPSRTSKKGTRKRAGKNRSIGS